MLGDKFGQIAMGRGVSDSRINSFFMAAHEKLGWQRIRSRVREVEGGGSIMAHGNAQANIPAPQN